MLKKNLKGNLSKNFFQKRLTSLLNNDQQFSVPLNIGIIFFARRLVQALIFQSFTKLTMLR